MHSALAPDLILANGRVLTADAGNRAFEAIAVKMGRILAVGGSRPVSVTYLRPSTPGISRIWPSTRALAWRIVSSRRGSSRSRTTTKPSRRNIRLARSIFLLSRAPRMTPMAAHMTEGVLQPNGETVPEPVIDVQHVARAVVQMASLPLDANVLFLTIMATKMPFVGRG